MNSLRTFTRNPLKSGDIANALQQNARWKNQVAGLSV